MRTATKIMSDSHTTASLILPTKHIILSSMTMTSSPSDSEPDNDSSSSIIQACKKAICNDIKERYDDDSQGRKFLEESCAIDPRFKGLQFLKPEDRESVYDRVIASTLLEYERRKNIDCAQDAASGEVSSAVPST